MEKLKPCPFCGGKAVFAPSLNVSKPSVVQCFFKIRCSKCLASLSDSNGYIEIEIDRGGSILIKRDGRNDAIAAWNRRVEADV